MISSNAEFRENDFLLTRSQLSKLVVTCARLPLGVCCSFFVKPYPYCAVIQVLLLSFLLIHDSEWLVCIIIVTGFYTEIDTLTSRRRLGAYTEVLSVEEYFQPTSSNIIGSYELSDAVNVEMDIIIYSFPIPRVGWVNILHCGTTDTIRMPGIWIHATSGIDGGTYEGFLVKWSNIDNYDDGTTTGEYLNTEQSYHLQINVTQSVFTVIVDDVIMYNSSKSQHTVYNSMICYASDPWYDAADVNISNLVISTTSTLSPTTEPSQPPSVLGMFNVHLYPYTVSIFYVLIERITDCKSKSVNSGDDS